MTRPAIRFTTTELKKLEPEGQLYQVQCADLAGFAVRVAPTGRKTFVVQYRPEGSRAKATHTIGTLGALTPDQAVKLARAKLGEVASGGDPQAERRRTRATERKVPTFAAFVAGPLADHYRGDPDHRDAEGTVARLLAAFRVLHKMRLDQITRWQIDKWKRARDAAPATIHRDLATLRPALGLAVAWELIEVNPAEDVKGKGTKLLPKLDKGKKKRAWSLAEEAAIRATLAARESGRRAKRGRFNAWREVRGLSVFDGQGGTFTDHVAPFVLTAINTGLRRGELFGLEWSDVDLAAGRLRVRGEIAKDATTRDIPLNDEAVNTLTTWKTQGEGTGFVFPGKDGVRLTSVKTSLNKIIANAGIERRPGERIGMHNFRHTFATRLVERGTPAPTIQELMGHEDIRTTSQYFHTDDENKRAAVALLNRA